MKEGDIIFCEFADKNQNRDYEIDRVVSVFNGIARTHNRFRINASTDIEVNPIYGVRCWEVLGPNNLAVFTSIKKMKRAKLWFNRVSEFKAKMAEVYEACHREPIDERRFFHEISDLEYKMLFTEDISFIKNAFRQPLWCGHPCALDGFFGCGRLLKHRDINEEICSRCECFVIPRYVFFFKKLRLISGMSREEVGKNLSIYDYGDVEDGKRKPSVSEMERLKRLFSPRGWKFADVLSLLYTPDEKREKKLDALYRETIRKNK